MRKQGATERADPRLGPGEEPTAVVTARERGETVDQVLDRNLAELLQELRVAITGVQILFAFLLGLAFTARFATLDAFERTLYTVTLLSTAIATLLLIAPVSFHRLVFRHRQKATLVAVADRLLEAALGLLGLAISGAVLLILDVAIARWLGLVGGGLVALTGVLTWYVLPLGARRAAPGTVPGDDAGPGTPGGDPGFRAGRDGHGGLDRTRGGPPMTEPENSPHTAEPAEGGDPPGADQGGRTPHTEEPAEGKDVDQPGADTPRRDARAVTLRPAR
jgi:hypothetical protein